MSPNKSWEGNMNRAEAWEREIVGTLWKFLIPFCWVGWGTLLLPSLWNIDKRKGQIVLSWLSILLTMETSVRPTLVIPTTSCLIMSIRITNQNIISIPLMYSTILLLDVRSKMVNQAAIEPLLHGPEYPTLVGCSWAMPANHIGLDWGAILASKPKLKKNPS